MSANRLLLCVIPATLASLTACAPSIDVRPTARLQEGCPKTVSAEITPWFSIITSRRIVHDVSGQQITVNPTSAGNKIWSHTLLNSDGLPQGRQVNLSWEVDYRPLFFVGSGTTIKPGGFTVAPRAPCGPPPEIRLPTGTVCLRHGELKQVALTVTDASPPVNVSFTVEPASIATPAPAQVVVGASGNSINLEGVQIGNGSLTATATGFSPDTVAVRVIEPVASVVLLHPGNGETGVFMEPRPAATSPTVAVRMDWQAAPGADEYLIHYSENNGPFTSTNSVIPEIYLSFPPGTVVRWKVVALFDACPNESREGPVSEERVFTVLAQ